MAESRQKRRQLSLGQKIEILDFIESGKKLADIASLFTCDRSTISKIKKHAKKLRAENVNNRNSKKIRNRKSNFEDVEEALLKWFTQMKCMNASVNGPLMLQKASQFAASLGIKEFSASSGWLERFKNRHNIKFSRLHNEQTPGEEFVAADRWLEDKLKEKIKGYKPRDIFTAAETCLLYKALQPGIITFQGGKTNANKVPKEQVTVLVCVNSDGSEKDLHIVGKHPKPACFDRVQKLPLSYYSNQKSWMTNDIWKTILWEMNQKFQAQNRKIILFVDSAACHRCANNTTPAIRVVYLPKSTHFIQPCRQGIIKSLKTHYRRHINRRMLTTFENGVATQEFTRSISVLDAMFMLKRAMVLVTHRTIRNGFLISGFPFESDETAWSEQGVKDEEDEENETFNKFVSIDDELPTYGELTDVDICQQVATSTDKRYLVDDDECDVDIKERVEEKRQLTRTEGLAAMYTFRAYLEQKFENFDDLPFVKLEEMVEDDASKGRNQMLIKDSLEKK
ncbi:tigger transposable element-derived protein 4-like [Octopus sinensis]|uniref:Tigger transposable element-derived protein 4-like n=1 Tax=Octopus sinensis TaxID=2607531 RepID=A0A6P7SJ83_9MOLL|nr:tigger transposable element-derived protein 4-like [Octopus sinensis]